jgi:hypothetical protein
MAVSFTDWVKPHLAVKHFDYNDVPPFLLARKWQGNRERRRVSMCPWTQRGNITSRQKHPVVWVSAGK